MGGSLSGGGVTFEVNREEVFCQVSRMGSEESWEVGLGNGRGSGGLKRWRGRSEE